jgi:hypothetical protein
VCAIALVRVPVALAGPLTYRAAADQPGRTYAVATIIAPATS